MFDRFTARARKVMVLSRIEAQKAGQDCIGAEHILLGLVEVSGGGAAQVLENLGTDGRRIRAEVEKFVKKGDHPTTGGQLPFTPGVKSLLESALEEALALGHNYLGTEHLLLGVLRLRDGPTVRVLHAAGVDLKKARDEVERVVGRNTDP